MRLSIIFFLAISVLGLRAQNSSHQSNGQETGGEINTITTAVPFLMISPDARSGGMGDVGVATTPDANSMHWNPAKYAFVEEDLGFSVSYTPWLRKLVPDINLAYLSGYYKIDRNQVISSSLLYFSLGNITFTDMDGNVTGDFKPHEFAWDVAYSRTLSDYLSGGIAVRYIMSDLTGGEVLQGGIPTHKGQAVAADVSAFYRNPDMSISGKDAIMAFGLNISNIGNKIAYTESGERDFIPINLRLGAALTIEADSYNKFSIFADVNKLLVPTPPVYQTDSTGAPMQNPDGSYVIASGRSTDVSIVNGMFGSFNDAPDGFKEELREFNLCFGAEYWYDNQFALRAGYFYEHPTKGNRKYFTIGAGVKYNVFGLDFAYLIPTEQKHPLENTLRFSLLFDFAALSGESSSDK